MSNVQKASNMKPDIFPLKRRAQNEVHSFGNLKQSDLNRFFPDSQVFE